MANDEPRRYQTRAASKLAGDHVSKLVPLNPPAPFRAPRITASAGEGDAMMKLNESTAVIMRATVSAEPSARGKLGVGPAATKKGILVRPPRATGIPIPTRVTRSSSARGATMNHIKVATNDIIDIGEQKLPSRGGSGSRAGNKKGLNEDKENQGPASEIGTKLKQQNNTHSIDPNPAGAQAAQKMAPGDLVRSNKVQIRSIGDLSQKERLPPLLSSPIHAAPKRYQHTQAKNGSLSPDELDCPVSVKVQPQARRLNTNIKLHQPEQVNLLASPPRRNASQPHSRLNRQLPAMVLTFNQPALLMQSPSKRGSTLSQTSARAAPGRQLAPPPKMDLLSSPPKRSNKKLMSQPVVEKGVDQLSLDTYKIENLLVQSASKGLPLATSLKIIQNNRQTKRGSVVLKKGALSAIRDTDVEGDVEMTDLDTDMEDCFSSPCPAKRSQGFQLYTDEGNFAGWSSSPTEERGVAPLVTGLEELGLGLKESRRNLFPGAKGRNVSMALEDSAQLESRTHNEKIPNGEIPIDPILLGAGLAGAHVYFGDVAEEQTVDVGTNKALGKILTGAVVFIDVHPDTTSMKLVGSLQGMGAKTVTEWVHNPDHGITEPTRIEISHVVFQGGGLQTLRKVKESQGAVICVGVEWVIACEKQQRWVDEGAYWIGLDMDNSCVGLIFILLG